MCQQHARPPARSIAGDVTALSKSGLHIGRGNSLKFDGAADGALQE
jgi:hypothetical protein